MGPRVFFVALWLCQTVDSASVTLGDYDDDYDDYDDDYDDVYDEASARRLEIAEGHVAIAEKYVAMAIAAGIQEVPVLGPIIEFFKGIIGSLAGLFKIKTLKDYIGIVKTGDSGWYGKFYNITKVSKLFTFLKIPKDTACSLAKKLVDMLTGGLDGLVGILANTGLQAIPGVGVAKIALSTFHAAMHIVQATTLSKTAKKITDKAVLQSIQDNKNADAAKDPGCSR